MLIKISAYITKKSHLKTSAKVSFWWCFGCTEKKFSERLNQNEAKFSHDRQKQIFYFSNGTMNVLQVFVQLTQHVIPTLVFLSAIWDGVTGEQMELQATYPFRTWFKFSLLFCWELVPKDNLENNSYNSPSSTLHWAVNQILHLMTFPSVLHLLPVSLMPGKVSLVEGQTLSHELYIFPTTPEIILCSRLTLSSRWLW